MALPNGYINQLAHHELRERRNMQSVWALAAQIQTRIDAEKAHGMAWSSLRMALREIRGII